MNNFITALADALAGKTIRETLLLVPSLRVGRQWLDHAARHAGSIAGVRTITLKRLIRDYADPALRARGLRQPTRPEKLLFIAQAMERVGRNAGKSAYFTSLAPSLSLVEALSGALDELECAAARTTPGALEKACGKRKGSELGALFRHCRSAASRKHFVGEEVMHQIALEQLQLSNAIPRLFIPAQCADNCTALERRFLAAWPEADRVHLPDEPGDPTATIQFVTADSPINEARALFRHLLASRIPLDQAEVVCLDLNTYIPTLCRAALEVFGGAPEELPITFAPGLPGSYSRPARLLTAWLEWLEQGLPAEGLARMLDAGLVNEDWREQAPGIPAGILASRLRALPLRGKPTQYKQLLGGRALSTPLDKAEQWLRNRVKEILPLNGDELNPADSRAVLAAAESLLAAPSSRDTKLDTYARVALLDAIRTWQPFCAWSGFNAIAWLNTTVASLRVMGLGAMPGKLHVADMAAGGHTGRRFTTLLGMDDGRYPGQPRQDPVLLDRERTGLSAHLRHASHWRKQRELAFSRLLGQVNGTLRISHASHENGGGRELFPATEYIRLREKHGKQPLPQATLVPENGESAASAREDWLGELLHRHSGTLTCDSLRPWFPHLANGVDAAAARASSHFTEYDGYVPEAGQDWNPREEKIFSPTHLEELAACPLAFFFKRILGIKRPNRADTRAGRWLEGKTRGNLLHDLFQRFLDDLDRRQERIDDANMQKQEARLAAMLEQAIRRYHHEFPPGDELAFQRETAELREAATIFLQSEKYRQQTGRPLYLEVSLGGAESIKNHWDREAPIRLQLDSGLVLLLQGRVDRIDRLDGGGLTIMDYKTGNSGNFSRSDPFQQGRHLQPLLYTHMLEQALSDMGKPEPVITFAYFFPMPRDEGLVLPYPRLALDNAGLEIVEKLAGLLRAGTFPFTTDKKDVALSDYLPLFGDTAILASSIREKCAADPVLAEWRELRELP